MLGVGSLLQIKRWDRVLTAACNLKKLGLDFVVEIAGSGPLLKPLEQQTLNLGLTDRVKFIGYNDDIARLLATSTFLVHTSEVEGCPNAIIEAMACGRPVVATDAGDAPSIIEDGKTGFVVRRGDDAMLVECMMKLMTDRELCVRMGKTARAKAEREFGLSCLVNETLSAYRAAGWKDI
jgi:glycosyltransferase involved in cell wall biosynthesis